jgi:isopentenyl diphosphate isomerase/L-lactate dehydrogenase-like FMN-dependent dehydrogenase
LDPSAWAYYSTGADDEVTLREERATFERLKLVPRVLCGVEEPYLGTAVLDAPVSMPVLVAPTALQELSHPEGEVATARAVGEAGTLMAAATRSSNSLEDIAAAATGPLWFQLYLHRNVTHSAEELVLRAERAGFKAIVLTVDAPRWGRRERSLRLGSELPKEPILGNFEAADDPEPRALSWEDVSWLRSLTSLPVVLKGVMSPEDAELAVASGVDGIVVSTHGGRQLDTVPAAVEALPAVVEAIAGRAEVYVDGGIRRGTDVLKALALGARAVLIGRPVIWGLAVDGESGARHVLELLTEELRLAMILAGLPDLESVGKEVLW